MKSREFIIYKESFDLGCESELSIYATEDYLYEELEIPAEYIESLKISNEVVNLKLANSREYFNDDWYVNLQRVS
ncbi:MAG: hypothetical protein U9N33_04065 [Campylobacterota bacterium]|nr:hypothetical protein [Campylobacterota bacterium]